MGREWPFRCDYNSELYKFKKIVVGIVPKLNMQILWRGNNYVESFLSQAAKLQALMDGERVKP